MLAMIAVAKPLTTDQVEFGLVGAATVLLVMVALYDTFRWRWERRR